MTVNLRLAKVALLAFVTLLALVIGLQPRPTQAGIYNSSDSVTYKEYWVPHTAEAGWNGGCPGDNDEVWYIEAESENGQCGTKKLTLNIPDNIAGAYKAELYLDLWRNHNEKSYRYKINGGAAQFTNVGEDWSRTPYIVEVPIGSNPGQIRQGNNEFIFYFDGSHRGHIHDLAIRIYYNSGQISGDDVTPPSVSLNSIVADNGSKGPNDGGQLTVNSDQLLFNVTGSNGAEFVEVHAFYEGYDEDNDGVFRDWHNAGRMNCFPGGVTDNQHPEGEEGCYDPRPLSGVIGHVGTVAGGSNQVTWNIPHIINQAGVRFKVRAADSAGNVREVVYNGEFKLMRDGPTAAYVNPDFEDAGLHMDGAEPFSVTRTIVVAPDLLPYDIAYLVGMHWRVPRIRLNNSQSFDAFKGWNTGNNPPADIPNTSEDIWGLSIRRYANNAENIELIDRMSPLTNTLIYEHKGGFGEFIEKPGPMIVLRGTVATPDSSGPSVVSTVPISGATNVNVNQPVSIRLTDLYGVDVTTIDLKINNVSVPLGSIDSLGFNLIGFNQDYLITYLPTGGWSNNATVNVNLTASDLKGNAMTPLAFSFTTEPPDVTPPVITPGSIQVVPGFTGAIITWETDEFASSRVDYGITPAYGAVGTEDGLHLQHEVILEGLLPGTLYYYRITSVDDDNNSTSSGELTFTTQVKLAAVSDDFNDCQLNNSVWEFINPLGDAAVAFTGQGFKLTVPGGVAHDIWKQGGLTTYTAPRIMQNVTDPNGIKVRFDTPVNEAIQMQGLIIQDQDATNLLRVNFQFEDGKTWLKIFKIEADANNAKNATDAVEVLSYLPDGTPISGPSSAPLEMTITRGETDNRWRVYFRNGINGEGKSKFFTLPLAVSRVGIFVGNANGGAGIPPQEVIVDWFFNISTPITAEDDNALRLPSAAWPAGKGTVMVNPGCGGSSTVTATANPGWSFSGWRLNGVAAGTESTKNLALTLGDTLVARFTQNEYALTTAKVGNGTVRVAPLKPSYLSGNTVTLTATPDTGWQFVGWSGTQSTTDNPLTLNMQSNQDLTATFAQSQYTLVVGELGDGFGTVAIDPQKPFYLHGEQVTLTATANPGSTFSGWSGSASGSTNPLTVVMDGNKNINANFAANRLTLNTSVVGQGTVELQPPPVNGGYLLNEQVSVTANPAPGWSFVGWSGDVNSTVSVITLGMTSNKTLVATFEQNTYTLQVTPVGPGTVTVNPLKSSYTYGEQVTLTANPSGGATFNGWSGALSGSTSPATLTIDGNKTVTAIFTGSQFTLALSQEGNGTVTPNPNKAAYIAGETVILTATPANGWFFAGWAGDLSGGTNPASLTMDSSKSVTARFTQTPYTLSTSVVGQGTVFKDPTNQEFFIFNDEVKLEARPALGWGFSGWSGDLTSTKPKETVKIKSNMSVVANFTQAQYTLSLLTTPTEGGSVAPTPAQSSYVHGTQVTIVATPAPGYIFTEWTGAASGTTNPLVVTMDGSKSIAAKFTKIPYTVEINKVGKGQWTVTPSKKTFTYGESVSILAKPLGCYRFDRWSGDFASTANPLTFTIDANKVITTHFVPDPTSTQYELAFTINPTTAGSVAADPQKSQYTRDEPVTLTAQPEDGWVFSHWGGDLSGTDNPVTIPVDSCKEITAYFTSIKPSLQIYIEGAGAVTREPEKQFYETNESVLLTAQPEAGWVFNGWSGDLSFTNNVSTTVIMDTSKEITATFTQGYMLNVNLSSDGGHIELSPPGPYGEGAEVTLTAVPDSGWRFVGWLIDGQLSGVPSGTNATATMRVTIPDSRNYAAKFERQATDIYLPWIDR